MKIKHYKSFIHSVTVDINPLLHDVLYIVEYGSGRDKQAKIDSIGGFKHDSYNNKNKRIRLY